MDKEMKSNIKIGVIALIVISAIFFGLYRYQKAHDAAHKSGVEHGH